MIIDIMQHSDYISRQKNIVLASGYFDPLGEHHLKYLNSSSHCGEFLVVAVNSNKAAINKKGFYFLDEKIRAKIIDELKCVDAVIIWDSTNVSKLIEMIHPKYFTNGGDVSSVNKEELNSCNKVGTISMVAVGGTDKINSSTKIIEDFLERYKKVNNKV